MAGTRVHLLAKELGVKSKAIIEKCQAEGLDIKNHMSTISAGLAATIREWFSEGDHTTTVERAERVNLEKVRVKKRAAEKAKKEAEEAAAKEKEKQLVQAQQLEELAEQQPPLTTEQQPVEAAQQALQDEQAQQQPPETVEPAEPAQPVAEKTEPEQKPQKPKPEMNVPPKPKPEEIIPAGPKLETPKPVELSGPRVVRVEEPEPDRRPRRPRPAPRHSDQPASQPLMPGVQMEQPPSTKKPKARGKGKTAKEEEAERRAKISKKMRDRDFAERRARLEAAGGEGMRRRVSRKIESKSKKEQTEQEKVRPQKATVNEPVTVKDLSAALAVKSSEIITKLMAHGTMATANQTISTEVAELVSMEFGTELIIAHKVSMEEEIKSEFENRERKNTQKRCPVVTMLGHVDHGKTSLLDYIRKSTVADGEAGGITQHIGAYQIGTEDKKITFLDTPGHEAFTAMRARGANMTDVVVLVVAADDGLMPQTIEAIRHAKAAEVPVIVALNKIDLPGVDINRIYGQLAEHELTPAEWSGDTEVVKTSAITGEGIDELLEYLDYTAELLELKADSTLPATGWIVEAKMTTSQGPVATLLLKEGRLEKGDTVLAGSSYGRVRSMINSQGKDIKQATSGMPVEISGLNSVPQAGDQFFVMQDVNKAKAAAEQKAAFSREETLAKRTQVTLDNLFSQIEAGNVKELNLIVRADVQGSVDTLIKYLNELSTEEVKIKILHAAAGGITEGDVVLAKASGAIIIGFNVIAEDAVAKQAEEDGVDIRLYNIIYRITEDLKKAMEGMLEPEEQEKHLGRLVVRDTFKVSGVGTIAGCYVNSGVVNRNCKLRLIRDNIVINDNCAIGSLKHFKDDVREVKAGFECGIKVAGYDDIKVGDMFDAYEVVEVARTL